jgi:hypothetical protein
MIRISRIAMLVAALLLAACGGDEQKTSAAQADSVDVAKGAAAAPGAYGGAVRRAQEGADSANAAVERRQADVDALTDQASGNGTTTPAP